MHKKNVIQNFTSMLNFKYQTSIWKRNKYCSSSGNFRKYTRCKTYYEILLPQNNNFLNNSYLKQHHGAKNAPFNVCSNFVKSFITRLMLLQCAIAKGHSVCLSVYPSITLVIHTYAVQDIEIHITLNATAMCLAS